MVIVVKDGPGFYTTRLIVPMCMEGMRMMMEGVTPQKLDKLSKASGWPVGAATLTDEVGFDVGFKVYKFFLQVFGERMGGIDVKAGQEMIDAGFLGQFK